VGQPSASRPEARACARLRGGTFGGGHVGGDEGPAAVRHAAPSRRAAPAPQSRSGAAALRRRRLAAGAGLDRAAPRARGLAAPRAVRAGLQPARGDPDDHRRGVLLPPLQLRRPGVVQRARAHRSHGIARRGRGLSPRTSAGDPRARAHRGAARARSSAAAATAPGARRTRRTRFRLTAARSSKANGPCAPLIRGM
jgi:hypothetical protein